MEIVDLRSAYNDLYPIRPINLITSLIVHHTDTERPANLDHALQIIHNIHTFHKNTRGWPGVAYHSFIWQDTAFLIRNKDRYGWHSGGVDYNPLNYIGDGNDRGIAVAILGNFTHEDPPDGDLKTVAEIKHMYELELRKKIDLTGHKDWSSTTCPGANWNDWKWKIKMSEEPQFTDLEKKLINTNAYLCDDLGGKLNDLTQRLAQLTQEYTAIVNEIRRVREQTL